MSELTAPMQGLSGWRPTGEDGAVNSSTSDRTSPSSSGAEDWALLEAARADARAFTMLFERHRDYVFRVAWGFCGQQLAEDVVQEVFTRVLRRRKRWFQRAKFTTLLYQITVNTARELRRKHGRELELDEITADRAAEDHQVDGRTQPALSDLYRALHQLSNRQREVVVLRHLQGLSTKETATVLGCGEGSVKVHLHRGLAALRDQLSQ